MFSSEAKGTLLDIIETHREIIRAVFFGNGPDGKEKRKLEAEK